MGFLSNVAGSYKKSLNNEASKLKGVLSSSGSSTPLGSLGDIVFEVSSRGVITFDGFKRNTKTRYGSHEIIGQKPLLEYLGPDGEEISFSMKFSTSWGVDPTEQANKLRDLCEKGEAMYLIIGNQTIGTNMWVIESVGEAMTTVDNTGRVIVSEVDVGIKEYVPALTGGGSA